MAISKLIERARQAERERLEALEAGRWRALSAFVVDKLGYDPEQLTWEQSRSWHPSGDAMTTFWDDDGGLVFAVRGRAVRFVVYSWCYYCAGDSYEAEVDGLLGLEKKIAELKPRCDCEPDIENGETSTLACHPNKYSEEDS